MRFKLLFYSTGIILALTSFFLTTQSTPIELAFLTTLLLALLTKGIRKKYSRSQEAGGRRQEENT